VLTSCQVSPDNQALETVKLPAERGKSWECVNDFAGKRPASTWNVFGTGRITSIFGLRSQKALAFLYRFRSFNGPFHRKRSNRSARREPCYNASC
jgi:hypothetical protein